MSNLFKESLKVIKSKVENEHSALEYELPKKVEIEEEYSVLAYEKFEKDER